MIRICGGTARGRVIKARIPEGVRPSTSRLREACFSMIGHDLSAVRFLDAFGGTGVMGFEAWSRGAVVTIVEKRRATAAWIKEQAAILNVDADIIQSDVLIQLPRLGSFDLVFADPPYQVDPATVLGELAAATGDRLIYESDKRVDMPADVGELRRIKDQVFSGSRLTIYVR